MMNRCRGRMVQEDYIKGNIFHKEWREKLRKGTIVIRVALVLCLLNSSKHLSPRT